MFDARLTETNIRAFATLTRFVAACHGMFKTNLKRIADYPLLSADIGRILRVPCIAETIDLDHIKRGYHSIKTLNLSRVVPGGPNPRYLPQKGISSTQPPLFTLALC